MITLENLIVRNIADDPFPCHMGRTLEILPQGPYQKHEAASHGPKSGHEEFARRFSVGDGFVYRMRPILLVRESDIGGNVRVYSRDDL